MSTLYVAIENTGFTDSDFSTIYELSEASVISPFMNGINSLEILVMCVFTNSSQSSGGCSL